MDDHDSHGKLSAADRDLLAREAASVMSSLDSRLSSLTQTLSIGALVIAGGVTLGLNEHPQVFCIVPFFLLFVINYWLMVSGDATGLATYRRYLEYEIAKGSDGEFPLKFETAVNSLRGPKNPSWWAQGAAVVGAYLVVAVASVWAGALLVADDRPWAIWWLVTGCVSALLCGAVFAFGLNDIRTAEEKVIGKLHDSHLFADATKRLEPKSSS